MEINVTGSLDARAGGPAHINYRGGAKVSAEESGSADILGDEKETLR